MNYTDIAEQAAKEIRNGFSTQIDAYTNDNQLVITTHTNNRARLETGKVQLDGAAILSWKAIVETLVANIK